MPETISQRGSQVPVISLQNVWVRYDQTDVLEEINLEIYEREFVALIGPNGGGKTTLIKLLLGLLKPYRGQVRVLGQRAERARKLVGYVPQDIRFDRDFPVSAWEVVRMGRLGDRGLLQPYNAHDNEIVTEALRRVEALPLQHRPIGELSGGERQRIYIARALAVEPRILLLDEPLSNIDPGARETIHALLPTLSGEMTIVMSSHDVGSILPQIDKIGYLHRHLDYYGPPDQASESIRGTFRCPVEMVAENCPCLVREAGTLVKEKSS